MAAPLDAGEVEEERRGAEQQQPGEGCRQKLRLRLAVHVH